MSVHLSRTPYGKSSIRLTKVRRDAARHELVELSVDVSLEGDFDAAFTDGDNRKVIATDSIRNTVLVLAHEHPVDCIETFGRCITRHLIDRYEQVERARARVTEELWRRLDVDGAPHPHTFTRGGAEIRTTTVEQDRSGAETVASGIDALVILKTTGSGFSDFVRDEFTTLANADDRILEALHKHAALVLQEIDDMGRPSPGQGLCRYRTRAWRGDA